MLLLSELRRGVEIEQTRQAEGQEGGRRRKVGGGESPGTETGSRCSGTRFLAPISGGRPQSYFHVSVTSSSFNRTAFSVRNLGLPLNALSDTPMSDLP